MEWNPKCDWDNLIAFNSKASESVQLADWGIEDEGEIGGGSFELSGIRGSSGGSGSDLGHGSSVKSSKSASTDSSPKEGMKASSFVFERFEGSPGAIIKKTVPPRAADQFRVPSPLEASVVSVEQLIGLKLGKRTYFENNSGGSSIKSPSFSDVPVSSTSAVKKTKSSSQNATIPRCQVEGCNLDLSSAKDYHRKHRVCDNHSKCPKVTVAGVELRFCQQCSRFHSLVEFDEKKRSCRRRLSDHNARRRKPRQETIQFNTPKLSSPFYDGRQQMNFSLNNGESVGNPIWKNACSSKFTLTEHFPLKPEKVGQPPFPRIELPYAMHSKSCNELLAPKSTAADVLKQGFKESISSNLDAAPEFPRALSLLSTNSWGSSEPESISFDHPLHANPSAVALSVIPQGLPLASPEHWQIEPQSSTHLHTFTGSSNNGGHFQEIHLFKPLNQSNVFSNSWN